MLTPPMRSNAPRLCPRLRLLQMFDADSRNLWCARAIFPASDSAKGHAMRHLLAKFALTTAVMTGSVIAAQACPQQTVMEDTSATASFQLAQAGGSGGGSGGSAGTGGAAGTAGSNTGTAGSGASGTPGATPGTSGTGAGPIIPPNEPMRQPDIPRTPGEPGVPGQTSPQTPR
jgi:hypothetical protein